MSPLVSIVVPVFNAAPFLEGCLANLSGQGLAPEEYEVVLVDDGSTDGSSSLCDQLAAAALTGQVRVLHQRNQGAGAARNAGMDAARGTYLYFFDADDQLSQGALRTLVDRCEEEWLDVLFFSGEIDFESEQVRRLSHLGEGYCRRRQLPGACSGEEMFIAQQEADNFIAQPCLMVSRLDFVRRAQARFAEGIVNEDNLFVLLATVRASRVDVDPASYYRYRVRGGTVTTSNHGGFRRFDAHLALAIEFDHERLRALDQGKRELAQAIAKVSDWFLYLALEAYLGLGEGCPEPTTEDPFGLSLYRQLLRPLAEERRCRQDLEGRVEALEARLDEMEGSTTWRVGSALTALPRALKDACCPAR